MNVQSDAATELLEVNKDGLPEQAGMRGPDHAVVALTSDFRGEREPEKTVDNKESENDAAIDEVRTGLVTVPDDHSAADEPAEESEIGEPQEMGPLAADSTPGTSDIGDPASTSGATIVPQVSKQALESQLDELTGELVAPEAFPYEIDDRAFENEWLGRHTDLSLAVFQAELLKTGEHTDDVDENGKLLSDPVKSRLARGNSARITLRVHRGLREDQKIDFILRLQARERNRNQEDNQELKRRLIQRWLLLGMDYEPIAKMAGVCVNTVRTVEKRAATDSNSKLGNTKRPDRRFKPETLEQIAEAGRLRAEGMGDADIAAKFDTDVETVGKWLKDPAEHATKKTESGKGKKTTATESESIEDIAASEGVPELHRRALKCLGKDTQDYIDRLKAHAAKAQEEVEKVSDIEELLKCSLFCSMGLAFAELRLRKMLSNDVKEAIPPGKSCPDKAEHEPGSILLGTVMAIETGEVFVALPVGAGVIDNRDNCLDGYAKPEVGKVVRVRAEGFDSKWPTVKCKPLGRQTPAPALGAIVTRSDRDDRCSPDKRLAGLKAGPKETEVTK